MKNWLQRVRGAIGIGATWAAAWAPIGALTGWMTAVLVDFPPAVVAANYAATFAVLGLMGGTIFSTVLRLAEGRRSFEQLSLVLTTRRNKCGRARRRPVGLEKGVMNGSLPQACPRQQSFLTACSTGHM